MVNYDVYGTFEVTTEGDCEGRSVRNLGTYTGYVDEIAFALADKCYYTLGFRKVVPKELDMTPKKDTVDIQFGIDSGTWDMGSDERVSYFKNLLKDREGVYVGESNYYSSVTLSTSKETIEEKRNKALSKLTEEEKILLGLKEQSENSR